MNSDELEFGTRLGTALKSRAQEVVAPRRIEELTTERERHHRNTRIVTALSIVSVALLALVNTVVRIDGPTRVLSPADPTDKGTGWFVPSVLDGFRLFDSQVLQQGLSYQEKYRVLLVQTNRNGSFVNPVTVQLGDRNRVWVSDQGSGQLSARAVTVAGTQGQVVRDPINATLVVQYALDDGRAIALTTHRVDAAGEQILLDLASVVVASGPRTLAAPPTLPDGYQVMQAGDTTGYFGIAPLLDLVDGQQNQRTLSIESEASPPPGYELFKMNDTLEPVTVRGVDGWLTTYATATDQSVPNPTLQSSSVFWRTPKGQVVSVVGYGFDRDEIVTIANNLREVSETEWRAFAETATTVGPGLGADTGPPELAPPRPPVGYRLDVAHVDNIANPYALVRYVPDGDATTSIALEIRLVREAPETWQQRLDTSLKDRPTWEANGRTLIDTGPGPSAGGGLPDERQVGFQWTKGITVEIRAHTTDGTPLATNLDYDQLRDIANSLNGHPELYTEGSTS